MGNPSTCIFSSAMFLDEGTNGMPVRRWRDLPGDTGEV
jgi:hypothetical protein